MTKYVEDLAQWVEKRSTKKRRRDEAAVAFVAIRENVVSAIDAGYAVLTIWEHMYETGKVKCSYETFRKHVHRFIINKPDLISSTNLISPTKKKHKPEADKPTIPGFRFQATPNKEDLL